VPRAAATSSLVDELIPGGTARPADVPADVFDAAVAMFVACRRLDMRALAGELGIGRATLYRRVAGRDQLLAEVVWYLTRRALARAIARADGLDGADLVRACLDAFMRGVHGQQPLRRLLEAEPEVALRVLTSKHGPVQSGLVESLARLLEREERRGTLRTGIDPRTLAFVIVRVGESFLYADVIADATPDLDLAVEAVGRLLRAPD
jgi:AcrR family transcriptional regulator